MDEIESLRQAISALEGQRALLGDTIVETALKPLREKLAVLEGQAGVEPGQDEANPIGASEQRKLVTILFADLVGFTSMSEQMDPEEVRDLTTAYFSRWNTAIEQFGGTVEKFIGDAVMAVFGLKVAGEAEPENAIRAALQIRDLLAQLRDQTPDGAQESGTQSSGQLSQGNSRFPGYAHLLANLRMRVGVHTGPVVVSFLGERRGQDFVVVGDSVNLASRLQSLAPVDGILISQDTYRHVRGVFDLQRIEPLQVKGKQAPVQVYVVLKEKPRSFRETARGIEGMQTSMIGRQAELNFLQEVYQEVVARHECRVVTIFGEAGLGKTRLLLEFDDWLELQTAAHLFKGRASSLTQNAPYGLLRDLFAYRFDIHDSDPPQMVRASLEKRIGEAFGVAKMPAGMNLNQTTEQRQALMKAHFIARLLGFEIGASEFLPEADPHQIQQRGIVYLGEYFKALAENNPVVILLEDLHWADDSTLDLFQHLAILLQHTPILILGASRPELLEKRPEWGDGSRPVHREGHRIELSEGTTRSFRIDLEPLSPADSESLVLEILQNIPEIPAELIGLILQNAEGIPFYVEELIKMLIDDGVIDTHTTDWQVDRSRLASLQVPSTLREVLQARFDSLSIREKVLLQRAAVVGRTFWDQALAFISVRDLPDLPDPARLQSSPAPLPEDGAVLAHLQLRELIFLRDHSALDETREFFFKHALLRDVTYESLLKRYRRLYHAYTAQWLETVVGRSQRIDEYAIMIAGHYDLAGESGPPLLAATWYARAARSAEDRYANLPALRLYQRSLDLMPEDQIVARFEICLGQVGIYALLGDRSNQLKMLQAMDALLETLPDPAVSAGLMAEAKINWAAYYNATGDYVQAAVSAGQAVELARKTGDVLLEIQGKNVWATACRYQSDYPTARDLLFSALSLTEGINEQAEDAKQKEPAGEARSNPIEPRSGAWGERIGGDSVPFRPSITSLLADTYLGLGVVCEIQGEYEPARQHLEHALVLFRKINHQLGESRALNSLGVVENSLNNLDSARNYYEQAQVIKKLTGDRFGEGIILTNLGVLAERQHSHETSIKYFHQSLEICRDIEDDEGIEAALIGIGNNSQSLGDYQNAQVALDGALEISRKIGDRQGEASILTSLGELKNELGQPELAGDFFRQSLQITDEIGAPSEGAYTWFALGRSLEQLGRMGEARQAFQRSLEIRQELEQPNLIIDSYAGLARTHLALGDQVQAKACTWRVWEAVQSSIINELSQPVLACLTCYRILLPDQPELARQSLQRGVEFIEKIAAEVREPALRKTFLEQVPENVDLLALLEKSSRPGFFESEG